jgi:osmotically inducible lipoprotein OsmB
MLTATPPEIWNAGFITGVIVNQRSSSVTEAKMKFGTISKLAAVALLGVSMAGCSTWNSMSHRQKSTVTGAGIGGVAGAVITGGGVLGTVGGAAVGGVIGNQVGK